ncbi:MAG TPA: GspE/PulE family protein [Candidatus Acidoferrales bacterium]|nr:GspE/PulE family protein [Candidatus Acidoferrales bacterium]
MVHAKIKNETPLPVQMVDVGAVAAGIVRRIPESLAWEYGALAVAADPQTLTVAFAQPPPQDAIARLERATALHVTAVLAPADQIQRELSRVFGRDAVAQTRLSDAPAVRAVDHLHERAFFERCSDIHIEPVPGGARVRFRVDGFLRDVDHLDDQLASAVASRIKILAAMDIAERRQPQDGRYTISLAEHTLDMRVSSVPARDGEKIVIRLLDHHARLPSLEELGMPEAIREAFSDVVSQSCGFVVVCGPTGSGKTTSLYAALAKLNSPERNICTVEDPVEQAISGITQVQVNTKAGVTFASVLRSLLRQDPDVIMVGEMRDPETANTAISAALSGQMVFTTLHSNDAPRTLDRLGELGVARSSLAAGVSGILAQRLVRRLCPHCKHGVRLDEALAEKFGLERDRLYFEARGCERCNGLGYRDRIGIFEFIAVDDRLRDAISSGLSSVALTQFARERGYRRMAEDCLDKLRSGTTSIEEFRRVAWWGGRQ